MRRLRLVLLGILSLFVVFSCKKDDNITLTGVWKDCVFVVNEGQYQSGVGTVMAFNRNTKEISGDLFETVNGRPLGSVVQSMYVKDNLGFIMVGNSLKIEVVTLEDFKSVATIDDSLSMPRYMVIKDNKAYVSCWQNLINVIDLNNYQVIDSIHVGNGPDEMAISGEFLYVVNSGGFLTDSTVSYFNINNKEIIGRIEVGIRPSGIVKDHAGKLWVLSSGNGWNGYPDGTDTKGKLVCIDPSSNLITVQLDFPETDKHPDQLIISGDGKTLYYAYPDGIYRVSADDPSLATEPFIPSSVMYYALGYDPVMNMIYASNPLDYAQNGIIQRFDAYSGSAVDSFEGGVIPTFFWFN
jgi:hypothetical protein